jgi:hypothetical protein
MHKWFLAMAPPEPSPKGAGVRALDPREPQAPKLPLYRLASNLLGCSENLETHL